MWGSVSPVLSDTYFWRERSHLETGVSVVGGGGGGGVVGGRKERQRTDDYRQTDRGIPKTYIPMCIGHTPM